MDISKFTIEDFVFNKDFRKWVLKPDIASDIIWNSQMAKHPAQRKNMLQAKDYIIRMSIEIHEMARRENEELWSKIDHEINEVKVWTGDRKVIPIYNQLQPNVYPQKVGGFLGLNQFYKVAVILFFAFGLGYLLPLILEETPKIQMLSEKIEYEEHVTPKGGKSNLTLSDGSKVYLNSGSILKYVRGFQKDKRELFLVGEAFFEVSQDALRPFTVVHNEVGITALGTSFNVQAYPNEDLNISLFTGKVGVTFGKEGIQEPVELEIGENLRIPQDEGRWTKSRFNEEEVLAWTQKTIVFNDTPIPEAIRILENWYGVEFRFQNDPQPSLLLSGKFKNETLKNVLEGLTYTTQLEFEIEKEIIKIKFK